MNKFTKIGIVVGAVGTVGAIGAAVHTLVKKSFSRGFEGGMVMSLKAADATMSEMAEKYNGLVDDYNRLAKDYCELLDGVDCPLDDDAEDSEED